MILGRGLRRSLARAAPETEGAAGPFVGVSGTSEEVAALQQGPEAFRGPRQDG